eukprot:scaffold267211_cov14-Prasinocladus_malaysianus.AAC.1
MPCRKVAASKVEPFSQSILYIIVYTRPYYTYDYYVANLLKKMSSMLEYNYGLTNKYAPSMEVACLLP